MTGVGGLHLGHLAASVLSKATYSKYICQKKENNIVVTCRYSKDVDRTKCQALTIVRITPSLYTTKRARIRCYTMLSIIFKCQDVQHAISV